MKQSESDDIWYMKKALEQADKAYFKGEVPVGAVIVDSSNNIVSEGFNLKEQTFDCTSHAEVNCIRAASDSLKNWRLIDCTLFVTLEPCPMCLYSILSARIKRVVFGAYDTKGGAISLGYAFHRDERLNHRFSVTGGVLHYECSNLLSRFFKERRSNY